MTEVEPIDYVRLLAEHRVKSAGCDAFVGDVLVQRWLAAYCSACNAPTEALEIVQGEPTFLFNFRSSLSASNIDDRTVAVWGRSARPARRRDRARISGFIPNPPAWSSVGRDRGHLVAHAAGGDLDLNLFPQVAPLNRGRTDAGRR